MSAQTSKSKGKKRTASPLLAGARPTISLTPVFAYFAQGAGGTPDIVRAAYGQFVRSLGLTGDADDARVRRAFMTWFVLEYRLASGKTPLEHFAPCAPRRTELERAQAEVLRQVANTQRFGLFWVRAADRHAGTLEDAHDGTAYTVHDRTRAAEVADAPGFERSLAQEGQASLMAAHLAEVAGEWRLPAGVLALRYDLDEAAFAASFKQTWDTGQESASWTWRSSSSAVPARLPTGRPRLSRPPWTGWTRHSLPVRCPRPSAPLRPSAPPRASSSTARPRRFPA